MADLHSWPIFWLPERAIFPRSPVFSFPGGYLSWITVFSASRASIFLPGPSCWLPGHLSSPKRHLSSRAIVFVTRTAGIRFELPSSFRSAHPGFGAIILPRESLSKVWSASSGWHAKRLARLAGSTLRRESALLLARLWGDRGPKSRRCRAEEAIRKDEGAALSMEKVGLVHIYPGWGREDPVSPPWNRREPSWLTSPAAATENPDSASTFSPRTQKAGDSERPDERPENTGPPLRNAVSVPFKSDLPQRRRQISSWLDRRLPRSETPGGSSAIWRLARQAGVLE